MLVVGLLAAAVTLAVMRDGRGDVSIAVADHTLLPGDRVGAADIRFVEVAVPAAMRRTWITVGDPVAWSRVVAASRVESGEPLLRSAVVPRAASAGRRAMSIPIDPSRAVNGRLRAGDRVDVVVATDHDVAIVASDLEVLDVLDGRRSGLAGSSRGFSVTLAVDAPQSLVLTAALADGDLVLTRVTGAPSGQDLASLSLGSASGAR